VECLEDSKSRALYGRVGSTPSSGTIHNRWRSHGHVAVRGSTE
jgi:hypothetical protein